MRIAPQEEIDRGVAAIEAILGGRGPNPDREMVLALIEHLVAALVLGFAGDPRKAAALLNDVVVPNIEVRLADHAAQKAGPAK